MHVCVIESFIYLKQDVQDKIAIKRIIYRQNNSKDW